MGQILLSLFFGVRYGFFAHTDSYTVCSILVSKNKGGRWKMSEACVCIGSCLFRNGELEQRLARRALWLKLGKCRWDD
jgi:hypothetical protein